MSWEHIRIALPCFCSVLAFLPVCGSVQVPTSLAIFAKIMGMFFKQRYVESSAVCVLSLPDLLF